MHRESIWNIPHNNHGQCGAFLNVLRWHRSHGNSSEKTNITVCSQFCSEIATQTSGRWWLLYSSLSHGARFFVTPASRDLVGFHRGKWNTVPTQYTVTVLQWLRVDHKTSQKASYRSWLSWGLYQIDSDANSTPCRHWKRSEKSGKKRDIFAADGIFKIELIIFAL